MTEATKWRLTRWFRLQHWHYVITGRNSWRTRKYETIVWPTGWTNFWCRFNGHPAGVVWYGNADSIEPNMACSHCEEDIG